MPDTAVIVVSVRRPLHLALAAGTLALVLTGCGPTDDRPTTEAPPPATSPEPQPPVTAPDPVMDRAALLEAIDTVASRVAGGGAPGDDPLANRRFRMRIAFGCSGPAPAMPEGVSGAGRPTWARSPEGRSIRLNFAPVDWSQGDPTGPAVEGFESVGGVFVNQPWMRTEGCPAAGPPVTDASGVPADPAVSLALLRAEGASRLGRANDRAFAFTIRGEGDQPAPDPAQGYRLVLEGRLTPWAEGGVVRCRVTRTDRRPTCTAGVVLDRLAYEDGVTGETLSEWRPG